MDKKKPPEKHPSLYLGGFYLRSGQAAFRWEKREILLLTNTRTCNGLTSNKDKKECFGNQLKVF
jgi:hypothetical protein